MPTKHYLIEQSPDVIKGYWYEFERYFTEKYGETWVKGHPEAIAKLCEAAALNTHTAIAFREK